MTSLNASTSTPTVSLSDYDNFMLQMNDMMKQLHDLNSKLKTEKLLVSKLEKRLENNYNELVKSNESNATFKNIAKNAQNEMEIFQKENIDLKQQVSDLTNQLNKSKQETVTFSQKFEFSTIQRTDLLEKLKNLEIKLHKIGQTEHTIHLNAPKELGGKAGLGSNNPKFLSKAITNAPTLYKFEYFDLGQEHKLKFTKSNPKEDRREGWNRKNKKLHQIPFCYPTAIEAESSKNSLPKDYFPSYTEEEINTEIPNYKPYIPTLFLEEKILQLEKVLDNERSSSAEEKENLISKIQILEKRALQSDLDKFSKESSNKAFVAQYLDDQISTIPTSSTISDIEIESVEEMPRFDEDIESSNPNSKETLDDIPFDFNFNPSLPSHETFLDKGKKPMESETVQVFTDTKQNECSSSKTVPLNKTASINPSPKTVPKQTTTHYMKNANSGSSRVSAVRALKQEWVEKGKTSPKSTPRKQSNNRFKRQKSHFPCNVTSVKHLIQFSRNKMCCSNCGVNEFVPLNAFINNYNPFLDMPYFIGNHHANQPKRPPVYRWVPKVKPTPKEPIYKWYGTYSIPTPISVKANLQGPNKAWVPKSV